MDWVQKTKDKLFFCVKLFFSKNKTIRFFSVHFITNPNDNSYQLLSISVTLKLTILEKKLELSYFDLNSLTWGKMKNSFAVKRARDIYYKKLTPS